MEEINNNINSESVAPVKENNPTPPVMDITSKQNNTFKILFIISILVVIGLVTFVFFILRNSKEQIITENNNQTIETVVPALSKITTTTEDNTVTSETEVDETSGWKSYEDKNWGLSFKYPSTYTITKEVVNKPGTVSEMESGLVLEDKTRDGNPTITLTFNPDGMGGPCMMGQNDYQYTTEILNNGINIITKIQNLYPSVPECEDGLTPDIFFEIGHHSNLSLTSKDFKNGIYSNFSYSSGDYISELNKIIETIKITKPEIYGETPDYLK